MVLLLALLGAIISGFGFAIGYGLAVAIARQIPAWTQNLKDRVRSADIAPARRWLRWSVLWRAALAVIFLLVTGGFGIVGLVCGWGIYRLRRRGNERRQQADRELALLDAKRTIDG